MCNLSWSVIYKAQLRSRLIATRDTIRFPARLQRDVVSPIGYLVVVQLRTP